MKIFRRILFLAVIVGTLLGATLPAVSYAQYDFFGTAGNAGGAAISSALSCTDAIGKGIKAIQEQLGGGNGESQQATRQAVPTDDSRVAAEVQDNNKREKCLDTIAYNVAKIALEDLTVGLVNWINGGFEGSPLYLEQPENFFKNLVQIEVNRTMNELIAGGAPFGKRIAEMLINSTRNTFQRNAQYSYNQLLQGYGTTPSRFYANFSDGGWGAWLSLTQIPGNNPMGLYVEGKREILHRTVGANLSIPNQIRQELLQNGGFLSVKKCVKESETRDVSGFGGATAQNPTNASSSMYDVDVFGYGTGATIKGCDQYQTLTPGGIVASLATDTVKSPMRQLELADEINESLTAVFDALLNQAVNKGLSSLSNRLGVNQTNTQNLFTANQINTTANSDAWYTENASRLDLEELLITGFEPEQRSVTLTPADPLPPATPTTDITTITDASGVTRTIVTWYPFVDQFGVFDASGNLISASVIEDSVGNLVPNPDIADPIYVTVQDYLRAYVTVLEPAGGIITNADSGSPLGILPLLRQLDDSLPQPNFGWEQRVNEAYNKTIQEMYEYGGTGKGGQKFLNVMNVLTLGGSQIVQAQIDKARGEAVAVLRKEMESAIPRIRFDIQYNNISTAFDAGVQISGGSSYQSLALEYQTEMNTQIGILRQLENIKTQYQNLANPYGVDGLRRAFIRAATGVPQEGDIFDAIADIKDLVEYRDVDLPALLADVNQEIAFLSAQGTFPADILPNPHSPFNLGYPPNAQISLNPPTNPWAAYRLINGTIEWDPTAQQKGHVINPIPFAQFYTLMSPLEKLKYITEDNEYFVNRFYEEYHKYGF